VIPTYVVEVDSAVSDFAEFARQQGTNYKILKYFNPWLRDTQLTNSAGKTYEIVLPEKGYRRPDAILEP
jgi:membrane-bound lytic murein transglycosylase D